MTLFKLPEPHQRTFALHLGVGMFLALTGSALAQSGPPATPPPAYPAPPYAAPSPPPQYAPPSGSPYPYQYQQAPTYASYAPGPPTPMGFSAPRHDGFFLRLRAGLGYQDHSGSAGGTTFEASAITGAGDLSVGGSVAPDLAIFGEGFYYLGLANKKGSVSGALNGSSTLSDVTTTAIGGGVNYYLMPSNLYLSGALLLARDEFGGSGSTSTSSWGLGATGSIGTEWPVAPRWGVGLAAQAFYANVTNDGVAMHVYGLLAAFSATLG